MAAVHESEWGALQGIALLLELGFLTLAWLEWGERRRPLRATASGTRQPFMKSPLQAASASVGSPGASPSLSRTLQPLFIAVVYGFVLVAPLALIAGVAKPGAQGPLVVFADALGFAGLSLIALQILVSGRWSTTTRAFGLRPVLSLHRQAGKAVLVLVVVHVVVLLIDDPSRIALLDPRTAPPRARAGMVALLGLIALAGTSIWRHRLGLNYERWRALHLACTALVISGAFAHLIWVNAYMSVPAVRWSILALILVAGAALFWTRVATPYRTALRPYRVLAVRKERGSAVTLELAADGHGGLRFEPGQFARLRASHCLYGMDDHPFTLSSNAHHPERPAFTVKALGDFSASLADLCVGTEVLVDGPHGKGIDNTPAVRWRLLVAAGIGITPTLSVLRTDAERGERRPLLLLYGSRRWADVTFREELDELQQRLPNLQVVHVLSRPEPAWRGERGRVGEELLRRYTPPDVTGWSALICGPSAMVTEAAWALQRRGVPKAAIQIEGFE
jgi:predicted ferric reductase